MMSFAWRIIPGRIMHCLQPFGKRRRHIFRERQWCRTFPAVTRRISATGRWGSMRTDSIGIRRRRKKGTQSTGTMSGSGWRKCGVGRGCCWTWWWRWRGGNLAGSQKLRFLRILTNANAADGWLAVARNAGHSSTYGSAEALRHTPAAARRLELVQSSKRRVYSLRERIFHRRKPSFARAASPVGCPLINEPLGPGLARAAVLFVLFEDEIVGHAGNVVANYSWERVFLGFLLIVLRKSLRVGHPESEEFVDDSFRVLFFFRQRWTVIEIFVEEVSVPLPLGFDRRAEGDEPFGMFANVIEGLDFGFTSAGARVGDQIVDEKIQHPLHGLVEFQFVGCVGIDLLDFTIKAPEERNAFADLFEREKMGFVAVVEVGGVIGDFVGQVDELGFEWRGPGVKKIIFCARGVVF